MGIEYAPTSFAETKEEVPSLKTRVVLDGRLPQEEIAALKNALPLAECVRYFSHPSEISKKNQSGNPRTIISSIGEADKFSDGYIDCLGLVVIGRDTGTKKRISVLAHLDPKEVLQRTDAFVRTLESILKTFSARAAYGSIESAIFGGLDQREPSLLGSRRVKGKTRGDDYQRVAAIISEEAARNFEKAPRVVQRPHNDIYKVDAYLNTAKAALTLFASSRYAYFLAG